MSQRCWTLKLPTLTSDRAMRLLHTQYRRTRLTAWSLQLMRERGGGPLCRSGEKFHQRCSL